MREFTTVVAFDALKNAQFPGTLRGPLMADTVVRDQMVNFVKIEALKPGAMSITILWLPATFDGPLEESIDDDLCKAIFCACPSAIEVVPRVPGRRFQSQNVPKEPEHFGMQLSERRVSVSMLCFDCRLHDIAEQKFLYPVWSLGMVRRHCVKLTVHTSVGE
jgi:hypothetical protein